MENKIKLIQSLERAFEILNCFSETNSTWTLSQISEQLQLNINTTRGLVNTLVYYHYLTRDESGNYQLGISFLQKAKVARRSKIHELFVRMEDDIQMLSNRTESSVHIQMIENYDVDSIVITNPLNCCYILNTRLNFELPLYATSTGKLILYYLSPSVREQLLSQLHWQQYTEFTITSAEGLKEEFAYITQRGYARERNELGYGVSSIALPILLNGKLSFTISATANEILLKKHRQELLMEFQNISQRIQKELSSC